MLALFALLLLTVGGVFRVLPHLAAVLPAFFPELLGTALLTGVSVAILRHAHSRLNSAVRPAENPVAEQIIEQVTEGILTINQRGQLVSLNPAAERLFGYHARDILNQPVTKLLKEPPSENQKLFRETISMGTVLGLAAGAREMIGERKNGEMFPVELVFSSMTLGDEQVTVAFARDVSKRKQAQRYLTAHYAATCLLAEANSLEEALPQILQTISESLHWDACAYWSLDPADQELRCTELFQAPFATRSQVLDISAVICKSGQGLPGQVCATRQPNWIDDLSRTQDIPSLELATPLGLHATFAFPVMMGEDLCGVVQVFSAHSLKRDPWLLDIMGEFGKQMGHFIARKRDEKQLMSSEERFRQLAENIHEVFWMVDARNDQVIYVSPSCADVWGEDHQVLSQPSVNGNRTPESSPLFDRVHSEDRPLVLAAAERQKQGEKTCEEYRIVRPDGTIRWVRSRAFPVLDEANVVYRIVGITADITEQKRLEDRLRQAQKMEAVGQLAGGVAHDFNNLLTVIIGYSEILLAQANAGDQSYELLEQIQKAGERAASLTRQLLAFGRKQTLQVKALNVNDIVQDMTKMLCRMIGEDIEMAIEPDPSLGQVQADPAQIEQILMNLATNARDAMPQGGRLTFTTNNVDLKQAISCPDADIAPGSYVMLTVTDTGSGMDEATRLHAFEPFFTTKDVGKGTGLGLSTVFGIVKQSNGHIELESQVGHGTTFRIYLPRLATESMRPQASSSSSDLRRGQETLLLVEDEEIVRRLTCFILQASGYTVLSASSGEEALTLCREHQGEISMMVTDILMPQMDGVRLAKLALEVRKEMKVLFISGYTKNILENYGEFDTSAAFLSKPVSPKVLANKVREVLDAATCKTAC